jgi:F0F1-type ATP synthase assembly protein I
MDSVGKGLALLGKASGIGVSAGCLTAAVLLAAVFIGLWLDRLMGTKPYVTLAVLLGSIPLSLALMVWWVLRETRRLNLGPGPAPGAMKKEE